MAKLRIYLYKDLDTYLKDKTQRYNIIKDTLIEYCLDKDRDLVKDTVKFSVECSSTVVDLRIPKRLLEELETIGNEYSWSRNMVINKILIAKLLNGDVDG